MKKHLLNTIAVALLATSASASADRFQILVSSAEFDYRAAERYEEMGVIDEKNITNGSYGNLGPYAPTVPIGMAVEDAPIISTTEEYAVLRDPIMNDGDNDGLGDSSFGDINFGYEVPDSVKMTLVNLDTNEREEYGDILYLDFRFVLEEKIRQPGENQTKTFDIIEPFSYFDLLTQDGDSDWGLALDGLDDGAGVVTVTESEGITVKLDLTGEIFNDPNGADTNNLPFEMVNEIDEDDTISFTFAFFPSSDDLAGIGADQMWGDVSGTGNGSVTFSAEIPEPATLGIFGLALTGMGIMQRRRKKDC